LHTGRRVVVVVNTLDQKKYMKLEMPGCGLANGSQPCSTQLRRAYILSNQRLNRAC